MNRGATDAESIAHGLAAYAASSRRRRPPMAPFIVNVSEPWGLESDCWQFKLTTADGKELDVVVRERD